MHPLPLSPNCQDVDAALRMFAASQCEVDWVIGEWLIAADDMKVHVRFGAANFCEYVGRIFGWNWRQALQRLDTARRLRTLPAIRDRFRAGKLPWSAVRETARVATADTEATWLKAIEGKTIRQIEPMVAGKEPGDLPATKVNAKKTVKNVVLQLTQEKWARFAAGIGVLREGCDEF